MKALGLKARVYGVRYPAKALDELAAAGIEYGGWLANYRVPEVFARYRVTVHIPRRPYARALPGIPTIRPFEAMACGIPLISAPWDDSERLFRPGRDFLFARDGGEMIANLRAVLVRPGARPSAGRERPRDDPQPPHLRPSRRGAHRHCTEGANRMRIAFFASSLVSAYWNGAATYYRGIVRALDSRGHRITFYEPDAYSRQEHRDIEDPPWAKVVVYPATAEAAQAAVESARDFDLIVKASGVGVFDAMLEAAVLELRNPSNLVAFWDVDAPATLDRVHHDPRDPFASLIPRYDVIFTYGGGEPVVSAYAALGARQCVPIYNALDPETHHPVPPDSRFSGDLGFLGNRLPDREARVDEFFFKAAAQLPGAQFLLGGAGWGDKAKTAEYPLLRPRLHARPQRLQLHAARGPQYFARKHGALRILARHARFRGGGRRRLPHHRRLGRDRAVPRARPRGAGRARMAIEVADLLRSLTPGRARQLGEAGRRRVLAEHTYAHRAAQVEAVIDGKRRSGGGQPMSDIVILGLSITSSWGNGHATTYRSLVRGLAGARPSRAVSGARPALVRRQSRRAESRRRNHGPVR